MNRTLSLIRYAKLEGKGWRRGSVVLNKNGKLRHPYMMQAGQAIEAPIGRYQLVRYEGKRELYTDLGNDPSDALTRFKAEESKQNVRLAAIAAGLDIPAETTGTTPTRKTLRHWADAFTAMHEALPHRSDDAVTKHRDMTSTFCEHSKVAYPDQITKEHVIAWCGWLQKPKPEGRGYNDRTRSNYYTSLRGFMRYVGVDPDKLIPKPTHKLLKAYTKKAVTIYDGKTVEALIAASESDRIKLCWEFAYKVGPRDSELQHVTRTDFYGLGSKNPTVHIKERDELGNIKDAEERVIELERGLASRMQVYLKKYPNKVLTFGTENDTVDGHLLRTLKRTAKRAGLNCGHCAGCERNGECREFTLHKFRKTYTSKMLIATGGDLRAVMKRTGHSDLDSVMRYLAPVSNVREALQKAF